MAGSTRDILARLIALEQAMGGWEATVWDEARRVLIMTTKAVQP
jgi:hypothetical protein